MCGDIFSWSDEEVPEKVGFITKLLRKLGLTKPVVEEEQNEFNEEAT